MDLRRRLAVRDAGLVPILKLIPNSATDDQIYFYVWVQEKDIASRIPVPASYSLRCVEMVKNWISTNIVGDPTNYAALLKLRPLTYTTNHYTELFKYCCNRKQIFTPEAIKKIEALLGFTTPNILYNLLETMKNYPTYQQYALAIAYFLHIDGAYYNPTIFLNFVTDGPSPTTIGESTRSKWGKWGNITPRITDTRPKKESDPQEKTSTPLKPVYIPSPNINQAARLGFSVASKRTGESSSIKITNPQKAGGPGIKMRTDNYITPPNKPSVEKPPPPIETNIVPTDSKGDPEKLLATELDLLERIERETLQRDQLQVSLTTELSSVREHIEKEALQRDQLEELLTTNLTARVDSTTKHLLEQAKSTETKLAARLQAVEKAQRLAIQQDNVLKSIEKKLTTDLENTTAMLATRLETIDQSQQATTTRLETIDQAHQAATTRLETIDQAHQATTTRLETIDQAHQATTTRLGAIEQAQRATETKLTTRLGTVEQAQRATETKLTTRLGTVEQAQKSAETKLATRLQVIEQAQKRIQTRSLSIENSQRDKRVVNQFSTRLQTVERRMLELDNHYQKTIQHLQTQIEASTKFSASYPWSKIDFSRVREYHFGEINNSDLIKVVLLQELLVKYADKTCK